MPSLEGAQSRLTAPLCLLDTVEFCAEYGASPQTPCYWLGPTEAGSILGFKISPTSLERPCLLSLEEWQGNGVCLLDIGLVAKGAVENPPESLTHLAHHPYRNRMAWVGGEDTMSIIPVLQTSGIPRYLNTGDVLAPVS